MLALVVSMLCLAVWILTVCHYKLKYQVAMLKQANFVESASAYHDIRRYPTNSSMFHEKQRTRDLTRSFDLENQEERTRLTHTDLEKQAPEETLTVNKLYRDPSWRSRFSHSARPSMNHEDQHKTTITAYDWEPTANTKRTTTVEFV